MAFFECEYYSFATMSHRSFTAVIPLDPPPEGPVIPAYTKGPYPTVYLLHGYSGSRLDYLTQSGIALWAAQHRCAVIMPDGGNHFYVDVEALGENYGRFIGEELVDVTRRMFNLSHRREDTVLAGLSMGGFGAILNGVRYPEVFGSVISMSAALIAEDIISGRIKQDHLPGVPLQYYDTIFGPADRLEGSVKDPVHMAKRALEQGRTPRLFLSCGTEDFLWRNNLSFHEELEKMGYEHTFWTAPGVHDFDFWNRALPAGLDWCFGEPGTKNDQGLPAEEPLAEAAARLTKRGKKELFAVDVTVTAFRETTVEGVVYRELPFEGTFTGPLLSGRVGPGGVDRQTARPGAEPEICAAYDLIGEKDGETLRVHVENRNRGGRWKPTLMTTAPSLAWLNGLDCEAVLEGRPQGPIVHIFG